MYNERSQNRSKSVVQVQGEGSKRRNENNKINAKSEVKARGEKYNESNWWWWWFFITYFRIKNELQNVFTLAIRKNIKIYTFWNQFWVWAYKYIVKNCNYYSYYEILKDINLNLKIWHFSKDNLSVS